MKVDYYERPSRTDSARIFVGCALAGLIAVLVALVLLGINAMLNGQG
jgi:hypothetical protein